ncbi:MAG: site-2 protease family protein [Chloroflexota bacterium]
MLLFLGNDFDAVAFLAFIVVAFFAFAYHELGHALAANYLGDTTPARYGRLTLNPIPHISLTGMVMLILIGFGWAVTPIDPTQFRGNIRVSHALVALAGPAANLIMAILFAIPLRLIFDGNPFFFSFSESTFDLLVLYLQIGVRLNLFLIGFNLLPIPPLDGFWVLRGVLPTQLAYQLDGLRQYGTIIFLLVIFVLPNVGISIFPAIETFTSTLFSLLVGV